eukprot:GHVU01069718.1.p1 GENE.GHVU01069718.1~~GHVU01069718.1.p1  ORF type:complete len:100 (+),score=0.13 GHVU01069718.1:95-394(+)
MSHYLWYFSLQMVTQLTVIDVFQFSLLNLFPGNGWFLHFHCCSDECMIGHVGSIVWFCYSETSSFLCDYKINRATRPVTARNFSFRDHLMLIKCCKGNI